MASWLVRSSPERAVRVRALAGDIVLCSWVRHLTLTVPLSTLVYKWVPANLMLGGNPAMDWHPIQGGVEILLATSSTETGVKRRPDGPMWPECRLYLFYGGLGKSYQSHCNICHIVYCVTPTSGKIAPKTRYLGRKIASLS